MGLRVHCSNYGFGEQRLGLRHVFDALRQYTMDNCSGFFTVDVGDGSVWNLQVSALWFVLSLCVRNFWPFPLMLLSSSVDGHLHSQQQVSFAYFGICASLVHPRGIDCPWPWDSTAWKTRRHPASSTVLSPKPSPPALWHFWGGQLPVFIPRGIFLGHRVPANQTQHPPPVGRSHFIPTNKTEWRKNLRIHQISN